MKTIERRLSGVVGRGAAPNLGRLIRLGWAAGWVILICLTVTGQAWALDAYHELTHSGDLLFLERADMSKARQAAEKYQEAMALDPGRGEAYWKLARCYYWIGKKQTSDLKAKVFEQGVQAALKAVELEPDSAAAHYWLGLSYAMVGDAQGVLKSLSLLGPIRKHMERVIDLDPSYDDGGAYTVLGRIYYELPGFAGGDNDKAVECYQKTIAYGPQRWIAKIYLAEVLVDRGQYGEAAELLDEALQGACKKIEEPDCLMWKDEARAVLKKLEAKRK